MEKKQRMFYFGTNGCAGHYALPINSDLPHVESDDWARFDGAMLNWIEKKGTYSQAKLFGSEWSVYAVPWSVDDARGGCHTDFLWEGEHTKEEMEAYIKQYAFLRRQFRFKLEADMVRKGDIVQSSDDTLVLIHHIGVGGEVYYAAYAGNARGQLQYKPYFYHYGYITDCYPATEKQKRGLLNWIKENIGKTIRNIKRLYM